MQENELTETPLVVCECTAELRNLPTRGPRSTLGGILPAQNDVWLNAGPRELLAFTAENADIKFPFCLPIMNETRECLLFDIKRHPCCGRRDPRIKQQTHAVMAAIAGYGGGYISKMQHIGEREKRQLHEAAFSKARSLRARPRTPTNMCDGL